MCGKFSHKGHFNHVHLGAIRLASTEMFSVEREVFVCLFYAMRCNSSLQVNKRHTFQSRIFRPLETFVQKQNSSFFLALGAVLVTNTEFSCL